MEEEEWKKRFLFQDGGVWYGLMMKRFFLLIFSCLTLAAPVMAQGDAVPEISPEDVPALDRAVGVAAAVDAYNAYCAKETDLSGDMIRKFSEGLPPERKESLDVMKEVFYRNTADKLAADAQKCDDIDFLLERLRLMKQLKILSYEMQGKELPPDDGGLPGMEQFLSGGDTPEAL